MSGAWSNVGFEHLNDTDPSGGEPTDMTTATFTVTNPTDPVAAAHHQARIAEYAAWRACLPADHEPGPDPVDWTTHAATLTRSTGHSPGFIAANLDALHTLDQLPRLRALVEDLHHLEMRHLRAIDTALTATPAALVGDEEFQALIDRELVELLSPTRPHQLRPSIRAITRLIADATRPYLDEDITDEEVAEAADQPPAERGTYTTHPRTGGDIGFDITLDQATGLLVDEAVKAHATTTGMTRAAAFADLVLGQVHVSVAMNLYRATDVPDAPTFSLIAGALTRAAAAHLSGMVSLTRDMDTAAKLTVDSYRTPEGVRVYLDGRDLVCRWPGCNRPAVTTQKDHRINHEDGGETTADNLVSLCQHHHNRKTDRQVFYQFDEATGDVYWLFADGTWCVDRAEGPLAPRQRTWVQTLAQRRLRRAERARLRERGRVVEEKVHHLLEDLDLHNARTTGEEADTSPPF